MRLAWWLAAVGLMGACGDSEETNRIVVDVSDTRDAAVEVDSAGDAAPEITLPPDFGNPCSGNEDCTTGFCVEGPSGYVCTKTCVEQCPEGWGCRGVESGSSDVVFVCVPDGAPDPDDAPETVDTGDVTTTTSNETTGGDTGDTDTTVGPDDTGTTTTGDTGNPDSDVVVPPVGALCNPATPNGNEDFYSESGGVDFPDCITGCSHAAQTGIFEVDLRTSGHNATKGTIDIASHDYEVSFGPDIDTIAIRAEARAMLEFAVLSADGSIIDPVVYISDGFAVRTYNGDYSAQNTCARTEIGYPYPGDVPIFVVVEHQHNVDVWGPSGYAPGSWVGGANYGYRMRIRQTPFAPVELGTLVKGATLNVSTDALGESGETRYYRFWAPGTAAATVTLRKTASSSPAFSPVVAGMKTMVNALEWQGQADDRDENGIVKIEPKAFRPCVPSSECFGGSCNGPECNTNNVEFIFAVLDYNGAGFPGEFAYTLEVNVQ